MTRARALVAFVNLAELSCREADAALAALIGPDALGRRVCRAFVSLGQPTRRSLPEGWHASEAPPMQACQWAFDVANEMDAPLLVVTGATTPTTEAVSALEEALTQDPLFGIAVPRICSSDGRIQSAACWDGTPTDVPRRVLAYEPEYQIVTDAVAACMLIRRELAGNLATADTPWQHLQGALTDFAIRARRAGFRTVLCNRVVIENALGLDRASVMSATDRSTLRATYPELRRVHPSLVGPDVRRVEPLLGAAFESPESLILDARNMASVFNGTSAAILGLADALHRRRPEPSVALWLHEDVAEWHDVATRYPGWTIHFAARPPRAHAAAIRLSQPWHVSELESIRDAAAVNIFWMLDTIAWDIVYTAPDGLDRCWEQMALDADAILFISEFSRQRFLNRFGSTAGVRTDVCRLSLTPRDYTAPFGEGGPKRPYWLLVGNQYDHKHIGPTVDLLTRAFPEKRLVVFGDRDQVRTARVTRFDSGSVDEDTVRACYARAEAVVFPSFYEGFGLPMVQGLAYGRTIVARESALVAELAARYRGPGRLLTYGTDRELITLLNGLERGQAGEAVPLGTDPAAGTWDWDAAAGHMLTMVEGLVAASPSLQMLRRTGLSRGLTHTLARR